MTSELKQRFKWFFTSPVIIIFIIICIVESLVYFLKGAYRCVFDYLTEMGIYLGKRLVSFFFTFFIGANAVSAGYRNKQFIC